MGQKARLTPAEKRKQEKKKRENRKVLDKQIQEDRRKQEEKDRLEVLEQEEKERLEVLEQDIQELLQELDCAYAVEWHTVVRDPEQLIKILNSMKVPNSQSSGQQRRPIDICTRKSMFERTKLALLNLGWNINGKLLSEVGATSNYSEGGVYTVGEVMVQVRDADKVCNAKTRYSDTLDTMKKHGFQAPNGFIPSEIAEQCVPHDIGLSDDLIEASFRMEMSKKKHPELVEGLVHKRDTIHILYLGSPLFPDGHPSWKVRKFIDYTPPHPRIVPSRSITAHLRPPPPPDRDHTLRREEIGYTTGMDPPYNHDGTYTKEHFNEWKTLEKEFKWQLRRRDPNGTQSRQFDKCTCDCSTRGCQDYDYLNDGTMYAWGCGCEDLTYDDGYSDCNHNCQCVYCTEYRSEVRARDMP
jgi:hypothetical protein